MRKAITHLAVFFTRVASAFLSLVLPQKRLSSVSLLILEPEPHGAELQYLSNEVRRSDVTRRWTIPLSLSGGGGGGQC